MNLNEINPESFYGGMRENYDSEEFEQSLTERDETIEVRELVLEKISNIEFDDVDMDDYPDFCDAYIVSADMDGKPLTDLELDLLNENKGFVYQQLIDKLF